MIFFKFSLSFSFLFCLTPCFQFLFSLSLNFIFNSLISCEQTAIYISCGFCCDKGPSIYDIHTEGGVRLRLTPVDEEGVSTMWTSTQKIIAHRRHPVFVSC